MSTDQPGVEPESPFGGQWGGGVEAIHQPCPVCGGGPIATQRYMYVMSFLIFTRHATYDATLCQPCATRHGLTQLGKSAALGWWGFPWGLLTFRALWLDARALMRWSTLAPLAAMLLGIAGLSPPALLAYVLYQNSREEAAARATGDWVDDATKTLVEKGHERSAERDLPAALEAYLEAHKRAPNSSVVNFAIANTMREMGRVYEALPYAARAEELDPGDTENASLHAMLLLETGDRARAEERANFLRDRRPESASASQALAVLFGGLGEADTQLRVAQEGLQLAPGSGLLSLERLDALLRLDRVEAAAEALAETPRDALSSPRGRFLEVALLLRTSSPEGIESLQRLWTAQTLDVESMERLAGAVGRTSAAEATRSRIQGWLHEEATPPHAWFSAAPWFDGDAWIQHLDRYLARRVEIAPALLRINALDPVTENGRILTLSDSARRLADPMSALADQAYFHALLRQRPLGFVIEDLQSHVAAQPAHARCLLSLCSLLLEVDVERARLEIGRAAGALAASDPEARAAFSLLEAELQMVDGHPGRALAGLEKVLPDAVAAYGSTGLLDLLIAEAALHAGRMEVLDARLKKIGSAQGGPMEAAALLLRWSGQLTLGVAPTYGTDVAGFLEHQGDDIRRLESPSAQAILVAEGIADRAWARRLIGDRGVETFELVARIKAAAAAGSPSTESFQKLAASLHRGAYGARLARTIVERSRVRGGATPTKPT